MIAVHDMSKFMGYHIEDATRSFATGAKSLNNFRHSIPGNSYYNLCTYLLVLGSRATEKSLAEAALRFTKFTTDPNCFSREQISSQSPSDPGAPPDACDEVSSFFQTKSANAPIKNVTVTGSRK